MPDSAAKRQKSSPRGCAVLKVRWNPTKLTFQRARSEGMTNEQDTETESETEPHSDTDTDTNTDMEAETETPETRSRIDQLIEEQGITRAQAQAAIETVQAGGDTPTVCSECGQPANKDDGRAVAQYPDPMTGEKRALCSECFADRVTETTLISPQQAQILALDLADWRSRDIQDALGITSGGLSTQRQQRNNKFQKAVEQLDEAKRTIFVLEALNPEPPEGSR